MTASDLPATSPSELKERLEAERRGEPFLVYRDGDGAQRIFALEAGDRLTVGRRPENDLALCFDPNVSGVHGAFERAGGEWTIVDDGLSGNGSYLCPRASRCSRRSTWFTRIRDLFPQPEAFRPERFLDGGPQGYSWIPFGGGTRRCPGSRVCGP